MYLEIHNWSNLEQLPKANLQPKVSLLVNLYELCEYMLNETTCYINSINVCMGTLWTKFKYDDFSDVLSQEMVSMVIHVYMMDTIKIMRMHYTN